MDDLDCPAIYVGMPHGGTGGGGFDDSIDIPLTAFDRCTSVQLSWYEQGLGSIRFVYATNMSSSFNGYLGQINDTFTLKPNEQINEINVFVGMYPFGGGTFNATVVLGLQFSTTLGIKTKVYGTSDGQMSTEPRRQGYNLGYVRGRAGAVVDMIQFIWYK